MEMAKTKTEQTLRLVAQAGVLRPRDLDMHQIPRQYLRLLCDQGRVQRIGRGLYTATRTEPTSHHSLAQICKRVPRGIICLLSALRFHEITTQAPFEVWLAIEKNSWRPRIDYPPLRIVWFSQEAFTEGVETQIIEGVPISVYNPAKTVADCFKYRNKIGQDVAVEALRECWQQRRATMDELWHFARICRVTRAMRPYLEYLL